MRSPIKNLKLQTNSISKIKELIPKGSVIQTYPFYDGSLEFSLSDFDRFVIGCTQSPVVFEFWKYAFEDSKKISEMCEHLFPILNENTFDITKEEWYNYKDPYVRSAFFFLLNRCSSLGMITHGEFDVKNFNSIALNNLRTFKVSNFYPAYIPETKEYEMLDGANFNLFVGGTYYFDLLNTEKVIGLEESSFKHASFLKNFKNKPSLFVYQYHPRLAKMKDYSKIFLDQYGRETDENNAKEVILHNV